MRAAPPDAPHGAPRGRLLVVGSINMDTLLQIDRPPANDGAVLVTGSRRMPGGHAANCASALKAMGAEVGLVGAVGDDADGRCLIADLVARGIDVAGLETLPAHRTGEVVIPTCGADHSMFVLRGANDHAGGDLGRIIARFRPDALVVFDPSPAMFGQIRTLHRAGGLAVPVTWVPGGINCDDPGLSFMLDVAEVVIVNATESRRLLAHASTDVVDGGRCELVTTLGAGGARLRCGSLDLTVPVGEVPVADTVGAGDAFTAAYVLARQAGSPPDVCLALANAAGTVAVGAAGARAAPQALAGVGTLDG